MRCMGRSPEYIKVFESILGDMGIKFQKDPSIRIDKKVMDKNGKWEKQVTTPDYRILTDGSEDLLVELTRNGINTNHKRAQRRVIAVAGKLDDYFIITRHTVYVASGISDIDKRRKYLRRKLGRRI